MYRKTWATSPAASPSLRRAACGLGGRPDPPGPFSACACACVYICVYIYI